MPFVPFRFDPLRVLQFRLMQNWWLAIWVLYKFNHRFIIFFVLLTFPLTLFMFPCLPQQWTMSSLVNPCATVTIMAASSTSSCSPPPASHYNLCSRRAKPTRQASVTVITYLCRLVTFICIRSIYIIRTSDKPWYGRPVIVLTGMTRPHPCCLT